MIDPRMDQLRNPASEQDVLDTYRGSVDRNGRAIAAGVTAVAAAPPGGVLVHCLAGKDRTGILIALVLRAVGVGAEAVVADYSLSAGCLTEFFAEELAAAPDDGTRERLQARQRSDADTMHGLLDYVDDAHGGAAAYLRAAGVSDECLGALAVRLLGEPD